MAEPLLICPLCGFEFQRSDALCHHGCPLGAMCHLARCPQCEYEFPEQAPGLSWLRRLLRKERAVPPMPAEGFLTVRDLAGGESAEVVCLGGENPGRRNHLAVFGLVPGAVYGWPKNILHMHGIPASILDLTATVRPQLTVVDAVTAMEGDGPIMGKPRALGFIAMGADLPAVDATCARVIGLDPVKVGYLAPASHYLGNIDERRIEQRGESPARYATQFDLVPSLQYLRK